MGNEGGTGSHQPASCAAQKFGDWLVQGGHLTAEELAEALREHARQPDKPIGQTCSDLGFLTREELDYLLTISGKRRLLGETLVARSRITEVQLDEALQAQRKEGGRLGEILVRRGFLKEEELYETLASQYNLPYLPLAEIPPRRVLRSYISAQYAAQNRIVPLSLLGRRLTVALSDPTLRGCIEELHRATGLEIAPVLSPAADVAAHYRALYDKDLQEEAAGRQRNGEGGAGGNAGLDASTLPGTGAAEDLASPQLFAEGVDLEMVDEEETDRRSRYVNEDSPVVQTLVQAIIAAAIARNASDIHLEADITGPRLRFRVDGLLTDYQLGEGLDLLYKANYRSVISRLKILARMDIAEKRRPQDASFRMVTRRQGRLAQVDFRLSTLLGRFGEGMVIRILDQLKAPRSLENLGLSRDVQEAFRALVGRPMGIILITGPTGSGKSSTLYAALRTIQRPELKILTAEDPVEYTHPGIVQAEVNHAIDNTFARLLRAFLRQDPDVIMVGEIRDAETAEIAMRAAQTGHLLFSTMHTTNSTSSVQRLIDLCDDPNAIAMTLIGVMAQRLVRKVCRECAEEYEPDGMILEEWFAEPPRDIPWKHGRGCAACGQTGYAGRIAVTELWIPSAYEITMIGRRSTPEELRKEALGRMRCLGEDALRKAQGGLTTVEEAFRVVPYEDVEYVKKNGLHPGPLSLLKRDGRKRSAPGQAERAA